MGRFYFRLEGMQQVADHNGSICSSVLEAFEAAQRLARDVAEARPELHRNTCVIVTERNRPHDLYCVSISPV